MKITPDAPYPKLEQWSQVTAEEAQLVYEMTLRNELSGVSPTVQEFERTWRECHGTRFALSLTNGTAALHSAMFGIGVGPGDEVICPTYTWMGSITPALTLMAKPVFCEVDPRTLLIDVADVRRASYVPNQGRLSRYICGAMYATWMRSWHISVETGVPVIEDCSHAHGAAYKGVPCGSIGHAGAWSLQGNKPISGGEGGMLATNDVTVFERACLLGQVNRPANIVGDTADGLRYTHLPPMGLGVKFRAHPLAIGIASVQLKKLDKLNAHRRAYIQEISDGLQEIPGVAPIETYPGAEPAGFFGFPIHYHSEEMHGLPAPVFAECSPKRRGFGE